MSLTLLSSYLPQSEGLLPKWLLLVSTLALFNSFQTYTTLALTRRIYSARSHEVTALSSRTFGTWTALSALVRIYAAYNISNPAMYDLALWSYVVAGAHFVSEWMVFGSAAWGAGLAGPVVVSSVSVWWMVTVRGGY